ncbi:type IV toxin-antitoxin system AbiEi family antitoxin domain-containing protein [Streptomyces klenkii]
MKADHPRPCGAHSRLHELAAAQGGVVLTSQAVAAGLSRGAAARSLRRAGWARLHVGAWAEPGREPALRLRLRAAQLHCPELVASHSAAAAAHGIALIRPCRPEFTSVRGRRRGAGALVHRIPLAESEVAVVSGVRVTTAVRTLCDLLRVLPQDEAVIAADSALSHGLVRREEVAQALEEAPRRPGTRAARRALALADPASGSPAETKARLEMAAAGLHPESQAEMTTAGGRTARLDFLFRAEGLGIEIEGFTWHGTRAAHQNDTMRFNDLAGCAGLRRILRFTRDDVFHRPRLMVRTVRRALDDLRAFDRMVANSAHSTAGWGGAGAGGVVREAWDEGPREGEGRGRRRDGPGAAHGSDRKGRGGRRGRGPHRVRDGPGRPGDRGGPGQGRRAPAETGPAHVQGLRPAR